MLLSLRKILRSEKFKENYIKVPDIDYIVDRHPLCNIERLNVILNDSNEKSDVVILKNQLEDLKKQYDNVSNEILTHTKQLAKLKVKLQSDAAAIELIESVISFKFINGIQNVEILDNALSEKLK
jgi:hypothetical protein